MYSPHFPPTPPPFQYLLFRDFRAEYKLHLTFTSYEKNADVCNFNLYTKRKHRFKYYAIVEKEIIGYEYVKI